MKINLNVSGLYFDVLILDINDGPRFYSANSFKESVGFWLRVAKFVSDFSCTICLGIIFVIHQTDIFLNLNYYYNFGG